MQDEASLPGIPLLVTGHASRLFGLPKCLPLYPDCIQLRNVILAACPEDATMLEDPSKVIVVPKALPDTVPVFIMRPFDEVSGWREYLSGQSEMSEELTDDLLKYIGDASYCLTRCHTLVGHIVLFDAQNSRREILLEKLLLKASAKDTFHILHSATVHLRYPNRHTRDVAYILKHVFKTCGYQTVDILTRIMLERLLSHKPHPWGVLWCFLFLISDKTIKFWDSPFIRCSPMASRVFNSLAGICPP